MEWFRDFADVIEWGMIHHCCWINDKWWRSTSVVALRGRDTSTSAGVELNALKFQSLFDKFSHITSQPEWQLLMSLKVITMWCAFLCSFKSSEDVFVLQWSRDGFNRSSVCIHVFTQSDLWDLGQQPPVSLVTGDATADDVSALYLDPLSHSIPQ